MTPTSRCGCCGGHPEVRAVRVTAWGQVGSIAVCPRCDLTPEPVQAPLHERERLEQEGAG